MSHQHKSLSKFLSLVLRHEPGAIGIALDQNGWVSVDELLHALATHGKPLARADLESIVATSDKRRFALNPDRSMIRANQGHSVQVDCATLHRCAGMARGHGSPRQWPVWHAAQSW